MKKGTPQVIVNGQPGLSKITTLGETVFFAFDGKNMTLPQWARATGIERATLWIRLNKYGWPIGKALTTPVRGHMRKSK